MVIFTISKDMSCTELMKIYEHDWYSLSSNPTHLFILLPLVQKVLIPQTTLHKYRKRLLALTYDFVAFQSSGNDLMKSEKTVILEDFWRP